MSNNNFLDFVYTISDSITWQEDDKGQVIVDMENKGFTNRIAQRFFKKPKYSHITLEGMGSYIFTCIDGNRSVFEIGKLVK
nr:PqqD family protein [Pseudobutyrivibrio sp.]